MTANTTILWRVRVRPRLNIRDQVVSRKLPSSLDQVAVPSASAGMEKTIGSWKSIIIELKVRLHGIRYSLDRSTSQRLIIDVCRARELSTLT